MGFRRSLVWIQSPRHGGDVHRNDESTFCFSPFAFSFLGHLPRPWEADALGHRIDSTPTRIVRAASQGATMASPQDVDYTVVLVLPGFGAEREHAETIVESALH